MKKQVALKTILGLSIAGVLFSGYLSASELFAKVCPLGGCTYVGPFPSCVYGFIMYAAVMVISILGLRSQE